MTKPLRLLLIEDSELDAELLLRELRGGGYDVTHLRVHTAEAMRAALGQAWDVVLCDYHMPRFGAMAALSTLKEAGLDIPFIMVSGTIGEDAAVASLKAGAHDFLLKGRLARLIPAIERELREAQIRRERRQAVEDLKLAVQARDEFLAIASHELKTPITALELQLAGGLKLLKERSTVSVENMQSKLALAARQVDRLKLLINNLLDVTRITSGHLTLSRREVDLREVIQRVVSQSQEMMKRSRSELFIHAEDPVVGCWDPVGLEALVNNLLSNAMKFGEGKPIEITAERAGDVARLAVADHGIGIAPEAQQRIFERFERAVSPQHYGGFGIGLWIARQIVEAHGGTIHVSSTEDTGSTFVVSLPAYLAKSL